MDDIINSVIEKSNLNPKRDFTIIYNKDITKENLIQDKKKLELTSYGIKNWLLSIDGKLWTKRTDFIDYMDELEREYYNVIENIKDDELGQIKYNKKI